MGHLQCTIGLSLVVVLMCLKSSYAIDCYNCNSFSDKRCIGDEHNKLESEMLKPCPKQTPDGHAYILCRKIKQVIDFEVNGLQSDSRVIRTCGWDDSSYKNRCYQRSGFGGRQEVCACEESGCNGSTAVYASSLLIGLLVIFKVAL